MPVTLSIKNVPDDLAARLRERAKRNHRSLQGELLAMLEALEDSDTLLSPLDLFVRGKARGLDTPREAAAVIRADRDGR